MADLKIITIPIIKKIKAETNFQISSVLVAISPKAGIKVNRFPSKMEPICQIVKIKINFTIVAFFSSDNIAPLYKEYANTSSDNPTAMIQISKTVKSPPLLPILLTTSSVL